MQLLLFIVTCFFFNVPVYAEQEDIEPAVVVEDEVNEYSDGMDESNEVDSTEESALGTYVGADLTPEDTEEPVVPEPRRLPADFVTEDSADQSLIKDSSQEDTAAQKSNDISLDDEEQFGIDTVDLQDPSGNWLYKRIWWEKAEARYDKIKASVSHIMDGRMYFFEQRVNLDRSLFDPFYASLGFTRGELNEAVSYLIEQLQQANEKKDKKKQERTAVISALQEEQENIQKLQKDVEAIANIDHTIDESLTKLMNQINMCRQYEQEAWQHLRSIARELSDKAARDHYYQMDMVWKNVKNVQRYIEGEFAAHFNNLTMDAKKKTETITQAINQLKEKGLDLKAMANKALKSDEISEDTEQEDGDQENEEEASIGWMQWIMNILLWPFYKIASMFSSLFGGNK